VLAIYFLSINYKWEKKLYIVACVRIFLNMNDIILIGDNSVMLLS